MPLAVGMAALNSEPCMQDELARVRDQLEVLRQDWLQEGAKQQPNDRLLNIMDVNFRQLAAKEERLMEMDAKWLEAHPPGEQSFQLACHAEVGNCEC